MYLNWIMRLAADFILRMLGDAVQSIWQSRNFVDPKSALQEKVQQYGSDVPVYLVCDERGPDHDKTFHVIVQWQGRILGEGQGEDKKGCGAGCCP